jgi:hypothetical protein
MTVAFDEDLLAPMLAGWQKVADCYRLRAYVFRAAGKIFAVTNEEQGLGELVTIIEAHPAPKGAYQRGRAAHWAYRASRSDRKTPESPL